MTGTEVVPSTDWRSSVISGLLAKTFPGAGIALIAFIITATGWKNFHFIADYKRGFGIFSLSSSVH